jgi:hypothetical protein
VDDFSKAALTALLAVVVYVAGKLVERAWIDPVLEVRKVIREISCALIFYDNVSAGTAQAMAETGHEDQGLRVLDRAL